MLNILSIQIYKRQKLFIFGIVLGVDVFNKIKNEILFVGFFIIEQEVVVVMLAQFLPGNLVKARPFELLSLPAKQGVARVKLVD